jgi:DnaK suppressor protein
MMGFKYPKVGVNRMNRERVAHFQKQLSSWQEETQRRLTVVAQGRHDDEGVEADVTDRASRSYEKELSLLTVAQQQERLRTVQEALRRVGAGEYGRCMGCGNEINAKRLEAVPWTEYCIECQQNLEQGAA